MASTKYEIDMSGILVMAIVLALIGGCCIDNVFDGLVRWEKAKQGQPAEQQP